ncbi:mediator of RNA polymerase II transcription subunit 28-like [Nannospalax galili]|uniref:mediator of RNA polymerase II transcription subunit 28-like n=1 Tax=Nannospalax galili TaxID=1026970 RepID=UPI0004ED6A85|nr:mediator of RNA polymerase II transcription subunit 28-like [Nannospalax galili]
MGDIAGGREESYAANHISSASNLTVANNGLTFIQHEDLKEDYESLRNSNNINKMAVSIADHNWPSLQMSPEHVHLAHSWGQARRIETGSKRPSNASLGGELESSVKDCFASLVSQDHVNGTDQEEIHAGVDQCIQKFLDIARQTECFILQKTLQLSVQKPEQIIKEDVSELRSELQKKDALLQKHLTKLRYWQQVLEDVNVQHKKTTEIPQGSLACLKQASANSLTPLKQP